MCNIMSKQRLEIDPGFLRCTQKSFFFWTICNKKKHPVKKQIDQKMRIYKSQFASIYTH